MTTHAQHRIGISDQIGPYSDAIQTDAGLRWLHTSGTPGLTKSGELPEGVGAQARVAWSHVLELLRRADMGIDDIVKVTTSLVSADDIPEYVAVRSEILGEARPAFMLHVVTDLIHPGVLVEIEVTAAKR